MLSNHPHIENPAPETTIWRYIDLEKLLSLLHNRSLFLCRLDAFRDPWEGSWPRRVVEAARTNWPAVQVDGFLELSRQIKSSIYVSCWHSSQHESAALWDLYSGKSGVAIRSTVGALQRSISDEKSYYIGKVKYIDFDTEPTPELNVLVPPFLKRKSFEHEREIRVMYWQTPDASQAARSSIIADNHALTIDPNTLIENLYISPSSPSWLTESLQDVCRRFDLSAAVTRSSLYDEHIY